MTRCWTVLAVALATSASGLAGCAGKADVSPGCPLGREHAFQARSIAVPHATLYCEMTGTGPPLILVHGAADHQIFHPVLRRLSSAFTVIYYDQRGFGRTRAEYDAPPTTLATDVADLEALRAALGLERFHLLALSNGGPIAIDYTLLHPDRVDKLILLDTYADNAARTKLAHEKLRALFDDPKRKSALQAIDDDKTLTDLERNVAKFAIVPHPHHERPIPKAWVDDWFRHGAIGAPVTNQTRHQSPGNRAYSKLNALAGLETPTLVICGAADRVTPVEHSRAMAARLPNATLFVIPDAGHLAFAEAPDDFLRTVREFLETERPRK